VNANPRVRPGSAFGRFRLTLSTAALLLGFAVLLLAVLGVPIAMRAHESLTSDWSSFLLALAFGAMGIVVAWHQPRNVIGWLLLGGGGFLILSGDASSLSVLDYRVHAGRLPGGRLAVFLQPTWAPAIVLMGLSVLLFPEGRLPSRRWRWLLWPLLAVGGLWLVGAFGIAGSAIVDNRIRVTAGGDLYAIDHPAGAWAWWGVVEGVFFSLLALVWLVWLSRQFVTFRHSVGERRLQLKWLMMGVSVFVISGIATVANNATGGAWRVVGDVTSAGLFALPITIGFGILKYRLYEIDRIVSRTISYAILTGLLVGVFVGIVVVATRVLPFSSPVAVAASTLAAAALFNPLRKRVQHLVDRRFNRARYDAEAIVTAFTLRLRDAVDLDTVRVELLLAVDGAVEPSHASLWIRSPGSR
jgi:hypothetical protein